MIKARMFEREPRARPQCSHCRVYQADMTLDRGQEIEYFGTKRTYWESLGDYCRSCLILLRAELKECSKAVEATYAEEKQRREENE